MKNALPEWLYLILNLGWVCLALSLLILFIYLIRLQSIGKRTKKYSFASAYETKYLSNASNILSVGLVFFAFFLIIEWIGRAEIYHIFGSGFFSVIIGFAFGYAFWAILKYYYPFILEKRLNKIRFKPMKSKTSGKEMRLMNEEEEDKYMTKAMIEEEEAMIADYDIWVDEETGEKTVEKYDMHFHALICDNCNFRTLRDVKEEIIKEPSATEEGVMIKEYKCTYCGHRKTKELKVASWNEANRKKTSV